MKDIKTNKTLVNVVLDRSGSMAHTRAETISGYNEYIKTLRSDTKTEYDITLIQFDANQGPELTVKYTDKPLADVPLLTEADYEPRGWTPLYDAIGECVRRVETKDRLVITVVITDGQENASKEFTKESIKALIADKEKNEHWTFVFLGADIDAYAVGGAIGMRSFDTINYEKGQEHNLYASLSASTMRRSGVAQTLGMHAAAASPMFTSAEKVAAGDRTPYPGKPMNPNAPTPGGRPAAPPTFRPPVSGKPRTSWRKTS